MQADTIWTNGRFRTLDSARPRATALAAFDGRIIAVGSDGDIEALSGPGTKRIDMHGRHAMPGLIESHSHALWGACRDLFEVYTGYGAPLRKLLQAVEKKSEKVPKGAWITGGPWSGSMREEMGVSPRRLLDRIAPAHPVALADATQHSYWCNSAALAAAGIADDTPAPAGGLIEREEDGTPNGILHEAAGAPLRRLTAPNQDQLGQAVDYFTSYFAAMGYVGFKEPMATESDLATYAAADRTGKLTLHTAAHISCFSPLGPEPVATPDLIRLRDTYASENLRTGFAKLFLDGVAPAHTASFLAPYETPGYDADKHEPDATLLLDPERLADWVTELDAAGFVVKMHSVGDNATRRGLDAIAAARSANGSSGLRHELAHCAFVDPADRHRFAALDAVAEVSPKLWVPNANTPLQERALGTERLEQCHPIKSLLESGATVIFGSDWPAAAPDANPWTGLAGMLTRRDTTGAFAGTIGADQAITLEQALPIFTTNAAAALGMAGETAQLKPGAWADFIVLEQDLSDMTPEEIGSVQVQETTWKGKTVHQV
jgi:predicted amidohydrolase YtcJ